MMIIIIIGKLQNQYEYKTAMANKATEGQIWYVASANLIFPIDYRSDTEYFEKMYCDKKENKVVH
jgi:hypothetical protein